MSREIKFRIWDKDNQKFVDNSVGTHCGSHWCIDAFTGAPMDVVWSVLAPSSRSVSDDNYYFDGDKVVKPRYIVQQYTGLKDKNGKEIYEGDIVVDDGMFGKAVVEYASSFFAANLIRKQYSEIVGNYDIFLSQIVWDKVIGNIFENPEIL